MVSGSGISGLWGAGLSRASSPALREGAPEAWAVPMPGALQQCFDFTGIFFFFFNSWILFILFLWFGQATRHMGSQFPDKRWTPRHREEQSLSCWTQGSPFTGLFFK